MKNLPVYSRWQKNICELAFSLTHIPRLTMITQKKLKKYEGTHTIELPYSEGQWNNMTEYEKEKAIEEQKQNFINNMLKDVFK